MKFAISFFFCLSSVVIIVVVVAAVNIHVLVAARWKRTQQIMKDEGLSEEEAKEKAAAE